MATFRSNNGKQIDIDAIRANAPKNRLAVGNMGVNAKGDVVERGEIVKKNEERVREYYKNNPRSSTAQASLKGPKPSLTPDDSAPVKGTEPPTTKTAKENKRTAKKEEPAPEPVVEPDEFDAPEGVEPLGYKEVELPNGDIEMVPYYKEEDK